MDSLKDRPTVCGLWNTYPARACVGDGLGLYTNTAAQVRPSRYDWVAEVADRSTQMSQEYEYRFVRLEKRAMKSYEQTVDELARDGWRLVQIFAPGAGGLWAGPDYIEVIVEKEKAA